MDVLRKRRNFEAKPKEVQSVGCEDASENSSNLEPGLTRREKLSYLQKLLSLHDKALSGNAKYIRPVKPGLKPDKEHRLQKTRHDTLSTHEKPFKYLDLKRMYSQFLSLCTPKKPNKISLKKLEKPKLSKKVKKELLSRKVNHILSDKNGRKNDSQTTRLIKNAYNSTKIAAEDNKAVKKSYEYDPTNKLAEEYGIRLLSPSDISLFEECLMKSELTDEYLVNVIKEKLKEDDVLDDLVDSPFHQPMACASSDDLTKWLFEKLRSGALTPDEFLGSFGKFMKDKLTKVCKQLESSKGEEESESIFESDNKCNTDLKDSEINLKYSGNSRSLSVSSESLVKDRLEKLIHYPDALDTFGTKLETFISSNVTESVENVLKRLKTLKEDTSLLSQGKLSRESKITNLKKRKVFRSIQLAQCKNNYEEILKGLASPVKSTELASSPDWNKLLDNFSERGLEDILVPKNKEMASQPTTPKDKNSVDNYSVTLINELFQKLDEKCQAIKISEGETKDDSNKTKKKLPLRCDGRMSFKGNDFQNFLNFHNFLKKNDTVNLHSYKKELHVLDIPTENKEEQVLVDSIINEMKEIFLELDASRYAEDWDQHISSVESTYEDLQSSEKSVDDLEFDLEEYNDIDCEEKGNKQEKIGKEVEPSQGNLSNNEDSATLDSIDVQDVENLFKKEDLDWLPYDCFQDPEFVIDKSENSSSSSTSYDSVYSFSNDANDDGNADDDGHECKSIHETDDTTTTESDTTPHEGEESSTDPEDEFIRKGIKYDTAVRKGFGDKVWKLDDEHIRLAQDYTKVEKDDAFSETEKSDEDITTLPWHPYVGVDEQKEGDASQPKDISIDPTPLKDQYAEYIISEMEKIYDTYDFYDTACRTVPLQVLKNVHALSELKGEDALLALYAMKLCKTDDLQNVCKILGEDLKAYAPYLTLVKNLLDSLHHPNFLYDDVTLKIPPLQKEDEVHKDPSEASLIPHVRKLTPDSRNLKKRIKLSLRLMKDDDLNDFNKKLQKLTVRFKKYAMDEAMGLFQGTNKWDLEAHWSKRRKYRNKACFKKPEYLKVKTADNYIDTKGQHHKFRKQSSVKKSSTWKEAIRAKKKTCNDYMFGRNYEKVKFSDHEELEWSEGDSEISLSDNFKSKIVQSITETFPSKDARELLDFLEQPKHETDKMGDSLYSGNRDSKRAEDSVCCDGGWKSRRRYKHSQLHLDGSKDKRCKSKSFDGGAHCFDGGKQICEAENGNKQDKRQNIGIINNNKRKKFLRLYFPEDYALIMERKQMKKEKEENQQGDGENKHKARNSKNKDHYNKPEILPLKPFVLEKKDKIKRLSQVIGLVVKESEIRNYAEKINCPFGSRVPRGLDSIKIEKPKAKETILEKRKEEEIKDFVEEEYPTTEKMENFFYKMLTLFDQDKALKYLKQKTGDKKETVDVTLDLYTGLLSERSNTEDFKKMLKKKSYKPTKYCDKEVKQKYYSWETTGKSPVLPGTNVQIYEPQIKDLHEVDDAWAYSLPPLDYSKCGLTLQSLDVILGRMLRQEIRACELSDIQLELEHKKFVADREKCLFRRPGHYTLEPGRLAVPREKMIIPAPWHYDVQRWPKSYNTELHVKSHSGGNSVPTEVGVKMPKKRMPSRVIEECNRGSHLIYGKGFVSIQDHVYKKLTNDKVYCLFCTFPVKPMYHYKLGNYVVCYECFHRERVHLEDYMEARKLYNVKAFRPGYRKTKPIYVSCIEAAHPLTDKHIFKWEKELFISRFINSFYFGGFVPDSKLCKSSMNKEIYKAFEDYNVTRAENMGDEIRNYFHQNLSNPKAKENHDLTESGAADFDPGSGIKLWRNFSLKAT